MPPHLRIQSFSWSAPTAPGHSGDAAMGRSRVRGSLALTGITPHEKLLLLRSGQIVWASSLNTSATRPLSAGFDAEFVAACTGATSRPADPRIQTEPLPTGRVGPHQASIRPLIVPARASGRLSRATRLIAAPALVCLTLAPEEHGPGNGGRDQRKSADDLSLGHQSPPDHTPCTLRLPQSHWGIRGMASHPVSEPTNWNVIARRQRAEVEESRSGGEPTDLYALRGATQATRPGPSACGLATGGCDVSPR
jgi:hypothetical protein